MANPEWDNYKTAEPEIIDRQPEFIEHIESCLICDTNPRLGLVSFNSLCSKGKELYWYIASDGNVGCNFFDNLTSRFRRTALGSLHILRNHSQYKSLCGILCYGEYNTGKKLCYKCAAVNLPNYNRFWSKVDTKEGHGPNGDCWIWTHANIQGYGVLKWKIGETTSRNMRATHASWILAGNDLDEQKFLCHKCDNPPCIRPSHLFLGTQQENVDDCISKGRWNPPYGERQALAVITDSLALEVRRLFKLGMRQFKIAEKLNVNRSLIHYVVRRKTFKHLQEETYGSN